MAKLTKRHGKSKKKRGVEAKKPPGEFTLKPHRIQYHLGLSEEAKWLYDTITGYCVGDNQCTTKIKNLGGDCMCQRNVTTYLGELEREGCVKRIRRNRAKRETDILIPMVGKERFTDWRKRVLNRRGYTQDSASKGKQETWRLAGTQTTDGPLEDRAKIRRRNPSLDKRRPLRGESDLREADINNNPPNPPEGGKGGEAMSPDEVGNDEIIYDIWKFLYEQIRGQPYSSANPRHEKRLLKSVMRTLDGLEIERRIKAFLNDPLTWQGSESPPNYSLSLFCKTINRYTEPVETNPLKKLKYFSTDQLESEDTAENEGTSDDDLPIEVSEKGKQFMIDNRPDKNESPETFWKRMEATGCRVKDAVADEHTDMRCYPDGQSHTVAEITAERLAKLRERMRGAA